jgi:hypothetical protein
MAYWSRKLLVFSSLGLIERVAFMLGVTSVSL